MNYNKQLLSGSSFGRQIGISQSTTPGNVIHQASVLPTDTDEVWLYAANNGTSTLPVTMTWGGTNPADTTTVNVPATSGHMALADGKLLQGGNTINIYVPGVYSTSIVVDGYVNRISADVDPRVTDWVARVVQNGGATPSNTTQQALSVFYKSLSASGIINKMMSVVCHVPDSLTAAITPLIQQNIGNDPWINHNFVSGDLTVNGLIGNGSSKYLDTGIVAGNTKMTSTNAGLTVYCYDTPPVTSGYSIGSGGAANSSQFAIYPNTGGQFNGYLWRFVNVNTNDAIGVATPGAGYYSLNRVSASDLRFYFARSNVPHAQNGSALGAQTGSIEPTYALAAHAINAVGSVVAFSDTRLSFVAAHLGLSITDSQNFFNAIQALRISLGGGFV